MTFSKQFRPIKPGLSVMYKWLLPRRVSLVNLMCVFLFVTIVFTAYLYGLIQIDTKEIIIRISPGTDDTRNAGVGVGDDFGGSDRKQSDSGSLLSDSDLNLHGKDLRNIIQIKKSVFMKFQADPANNNEISTQKDDDTSYSLDTNITNFFKRMDRNRAALLNKLAIEEIDDLLQLKNKLMLAVNLNENDNEDSEDVPVAVAPAPTPGQAPAPDKNHASQVFFALNSTHKQHNNQKANQMQATTFKPITRELMIRFLKLEKFRLQKMKKIKTVDQLLEEFISQSDLNRDELPDIWKNYFVNINELKLYNNTKVVDELLEKISKAPVTNCYEKEKGTQIKLLLNLEDGTEVLVKPMKVPRNYETPPDHFYFVDFERHHAEIAAFHVDRLLGFYRVPPTVGRVFNMTSDLWDKADEDLSKTFFYSPAGNVCFTGHCSYYCDSTHATCGRPLDRMEGSVQLMLPSKPIVKWEAFRHPYRRTYTKRNKALWEVDDSYCSTNLLKDIRYSNKLILDLMDMTVFDFLTGNMDRHHYEKMISLGNDTFLLHLDNGRSFGKIYSDEMSILAPLKQCCLMRFSTFERLKSLYMNRFSKLLDDSLRTDPLYPILTKDHLVAIDRRLSLIFYQLIDCTQRFKYFEVIVDDGY